MNRWANSTRHDRLPPNWKTTRARILKRDPLCRINGPTCTGISTDVDHIRRGDDHADHNLQGLCHPCHALKTINERSASQRRHPPEPHPGLRS